MTQWVHLSYDIWGGEAYHLDTRVAQWAYLGYGMWGEGQVPWRIGMA